ncbi:hypothetical protein EYF80_051765 [Liparis tanakae]|uniref:Uncharacterized protein n=1 Tax=Liparis tanakae TaxID=230148 RepID=A0A4Z2F9Z2_9TELE|nr:hypothetical protein EYF80_051765 [Liparis tanakae]
MMSRGDGLHFSSGATCLWTEESLQKLRWSERSELFRQRVEHRAAICFSKPSPRVATAGLAPRLHRGVTEEGSDGASRGSRKRAVDMNALTIHTPKPPNDELMIAVFDWLERRAKAVQLAHTNRGGGGASPPTEAVGSADWVSHCYAGPS